MDFDKHFQYKKIETNEDILEAYEIYRTNEKYFRQVAGKCPELQDVGSDLTALPDGASFCKKHYGLFLKDGQPVAVLAAVEGFPEPDVFYIGLLMVNGSAQRKGVGRTIYLHMEEKAFRLGYRRIRLGVTDRNEKGRSFWEAMGFYEVKTVETRSPYGTDWLVYVMEKKLAAA